MTKCVNKKVCDKAVCDNVWERWCVAKLCVCDKVVSEQLFATKFRASTVPKVPSEPGV